MKKICDICGEKFIADGHSITCDKCHKDQFKSPFKEFGELKHRLINQTAGFRKKRYGDILPGQNI